MGKSFNDRVLYVNPDAGNCNWDIDWFRNNSMNAALLPPILDGNFVYSGIVPSAGTGLLVDLTSGFVKVDGTKFTIAAQSATVVGASLLAEEINFIYVDNTGTVVVTQSEPTVTCALIAIVDTDTTSVLRITDGRKMQVDHDAFYEMENDIINGTMRLWQRGISHSTTGFGSIDRFQSTFGVSTTITTTRGSFAIGQTDVPHNPRYYTSLAVVSGGLAGSYGIFQHRLRGVRKYSGKRVCFRFHAKANSSGKYLAVEGLQSFGTGGSSSVTGISAQKVELTTSWQEFVAYIDFPSIAGKTLGALNNSSIFIWCEGGSDFNVRTDTLGLQSGTFDIAQISSIISDIELPVRWRTESEETALCQVYCNVVSGSVFNSGSRFLFPIGTANAVHMGSYSFPVRMLKIPSATGSSGMSLTNCTTPVVTSNIDSASLKVNATTINTYTNAYGGTITFEAEL